MAVGGWCRGLKLKHQRQHNTVSVIGEIMIGELQARRNRAIGNGEYWKMCGEYG